MTSDEPTGGNIQHMTPVEHNTITVPSTVVIDADGAVVANVGGVAVVDANGAAVDDAHGTMVVDEDAMPIAAMDYRRPMMFVFRDPTLSFGHLGPRDVHWASP